MIRNLESLAGKTKFKFHLDFSNFYDQMNYPRQSGAFPFEEDSSTKMRKV